MTMELWSFSHALDVDAAELRGMSVEARDGGIGTVVEVVDRPAGAWLIVDTGPWIFGKNVILPAGVVTGVDRAGGSVFVDRLKDDVKNAPEHDPDADDIAQREALSAHYGAAPATGGFEPAAPPTPSFGGPSETEPIGGGLRDEQDTGASVPSGGEISPPEEAPEPAQEVLPQPRFARETDSSGTKEKAKGATRARQSTPRTSSADVPIARYDSLSAGEVLARLRNLSQRELAQVERYEKRHESRRTVLNRIESLREKEPWRGYDDATVGEIKKKLASSDDERAKSVRNYERRHRDRKGVMEAARRAVASA